ncbi:MAG TPA: hypothetical protein VM733_06570 [Thermoanaerobaculia bacterium]|nr:hypothetical protein [Thermoanaerobaculia bacterium]
MLVIVARVRRGSILSVVPGWLAAAALAPVIATFFAVRGVIGALQAMAMSGGGIAAVCAGMYEATRPLMYASAFACVIAIAAIIAAIRGVTDADDETPRRSLIAILVAIAAAAAIFLSAVQYRGAGRAILNVIDPGANASQTGGIASVSQDIATRLFTTATVAAVLTLLLLIAIVFAALTRREAGLPLVFAAILVLLAAGMSFMMHRGWSARLQHTAMTGEIEH